MEEQIHHEQKTGKRPLWHSRSILLLAICAGILVFSIALSLLTKGPQTPHDLIRLSKSVRFTIYYPKPLPSAYNYGDKPASLDGGVVIYFLTDGGQTITISEQAIPKAPPDLYHLVNFTPFQSSLGPAVEGTSLGRSIAIEMSNTTLVTITGAQGISSGIIRTTAENLQTLQ